MTVLAPSAVFLLTVTDSVAVSSTFMERDLLLNEAVYVTFPAPGSFPASSPSAIAGGIREKSIKAASKKPVSLRRKLFVPTIIHSPPCGIKRRGQGAVPAVRSLVCTILIPRLLGNNYPAASKRSIQSGFCRLIHQSDSGYCAVASGICNIAVIEQSQGVPYMDAFI